jgi:hypothetical protein
MNDFDVAVPYPPAFAVNVQEAPVGAVITRLSKVAIPLLSVTVTELTLEVASVQLLVIVTVPLPSKPLSRTFTTGSAVPVVPVFGGSGEKLTPQDVAAICVFSCEGGCGASGMVKPLSDVPPYTVEPQVTVVPLHIGSTFTVTFKVRDDGYVTAGEMLVMETEATPPDVEEIVAVVPAGNPTPVILRPVGALSVSAPNDAPVVAAAKL